MTRRAIAVVMLAAGVLAPAAVGADEPVIASAGDKGFGLRSADGTFEFRLRGLLQVDARFFADDAQAFNDTFVLRRLEPSFEFTLGKLAYVKLQPQFAGDAATTSDVFGELRFTPAATLRFGKFKTPLALEYLQSSSALAFVERGLPTEAGAGRDFGVQLHGALPAGVSYAIAWLNGAPDGRDAANSDTDNHKEVAARVFIEPLPGLGLGLAATRGTKVGVIASSASATTATFNNTLPRYRSPGQNTIFTYLGSTTAPTAANTVIAAGTHTRLSPQLTLYRGPFGLLAEHLSSEQDVSINGVAQTFEHTAWQAAASWVLTGEDASYKGIKPAAPYAGGAAGWGAFELALRHGVLDVDDGVFPAYADPTASVSEATSTGVALHWHLDANVRTSLDYEATGFEGGAAGGNRRDEKALFARLQVAF
jgi:phosphate-selective porin OprO/OprP